MTEVVHEANSDSPEDHHPAQTETPDGTKKVNSGLGHITKDSGLQKNEVGTVMLMDYPIVSLRIDGQDRLCLAQISCTLLKQFSYNEIHNRRVALGITCVQCTPVQLEILRRAGAMPISSRRCGMITKREAERLCHSFLSEHTPPQLPEDFAFEVKHECAWGSRGHFLPTRYNSSRAKCIKCVHCHMFFSPNKFIFHSHRLPSSTYIQPDAANFNSWRRHLTLVDSEDGNMDWIRHSWEDVKAMFNGGSRKRIIATSLEKVKTQTSERKVAKLALKATEPAQRPEQKTPHKSKAHDKTQHEETPDPGRSIPIEEHGTLDRISSDPNSFPCMASSESNSLSWLPQNYQQAAVAAAAATINARMNAATFYNSPFYGTGVPASLLTSMPIPFQIPPSLVSLHSRKNDDNNSELSEKNANSHKETTQNHDECQVECDTKYGNLSKEQLQNMLITEIETRQKLEHELKLLKNSVLPKIHNMLLPN